MNRLYKLCTTSYVTIQQHEQAIYVMYNIIVTILQHEQAI